MAKKEKTDFGFEVEQKLLEADVKLTPCRGCGEPLIFLKNEKERWITLDMNLDLHFGKCPDKDKIRRSR